MATLDHIKGINNPLGAGISKENEINLKGLVNLALNSSPQVGIVNFNILKTFLLELLKALNIQNYEPKFADDLETKAIIEDALLNENQHVISSLIENNNNTNNDSSSDNNNNNLDSNLKKSSNNAISLLTSDLKPLTLERFHKFEDKLTRLEQQISSFNSLPSNQQIIDKSKDIKKSNGNSGPILEVWQYTQMSKRLESNEDGITKLTSLLQDLIGDINDLRESQQKNSTEIDNLNINYKTLLDRFNQFEKLKNNMPSLEKIKELENMIEMLKNDMNILGNFDDRFKNLEEQIKYFESQMITLVKHPDLELYVTWNALEASLKGIKETLDSAVNKPQIISEQRFTQTTPLPPPDKSKTPTLERIKTPASKNEHNPTQELQDLLNKLGTLNERHEKLKDLVEKLQLDLLNRPKTAYDSSNNNDTKLPDDFIQKLDDIKQIKAALEELKENFTNETNKRMHFENLISNLNNELDKIRSGLKECLKNTQLNKDEIESLKEAIRLLEEAKADKEWVKSEFERKADKRDLDQRVHKKMFEDTCQGLSSNINSCLQKQTNLEDEYRANSQNIFKELENKLDRLELDSLKEQIEKQLKKLRKIQKENVVPLPQNISQLNPEDDAAGLRKQLLRFHCISCDRPIEMNSGHIPIPSLPAERGIRPIQTPRPYTTYELDQIRQFQRQHLIPDNAYDLFASVRQCGGPHTLTVPHRKLIKLPSNIIDDTAQSVPSTTTNHKNEVQIQGQDGNIYKGRIDARLPVEMKKTAKLASHSYLPPKSAGYNHIHQNHINLQQLRPQSSHYTRFSTNDDKTVTDESIDKIPIDHENLP